MTEKSKKSFVLYADFEGALMRLSMKERGMLFTMIYSYVNRGAVDEIDVTPMVDLSFAVIRAQLDRDREKYEKACERNAKNGSKGGRPKKAEKTQWVFEKPKKPDSDNENESDNDNAIDSDNDNERHAARRSFEPNDFFEAALRRTYGEKEKEKGKEKEKEKDK